MIPLERCIAGGLAWRDGALVDKNLTAEEISGALGTEGEIAWIDLLRPTREQLLELATRIDLPTTTIEDALAPHERPKITRHGSHLFFTAYATYVDDTPNEGGTRVRTPRISGLVLPRILVTIRLDDEFDMVPVIARWAENIELTKLGVSALLHGLLDVVVDSHFEAIQRLDDEIEGLEDELFAEHRLNHDFVRRIYGFRKDLVLLRRVVLPMREVVNAIMRHRNRSNTDLDHWYDDLYDHVLRAAEWTESLRDLISTVFETNLSLQDSRLNRVMKKLAGWAAIIAIPTAITGWFGQNVPYPGFGNAFGLWLSLITIVGISGLLYVLFKRRDWL